MSKKMWNKIFKSKSQKQQQQLNKINKRHSRGIFEEYQQLNELLVGEKVENGCNENAPPNGNGNEYGNRNVSGNGNGKGNINVFQQPPQRSSFNSSSLSEAQQQQQQQQQQQTQRQHHLSTFSRVCNTFSLRRNSSNNNNNIINNKQPPNAKSSITDSDNNECGDGEDIDVPPPGPLTTGYSIPISEDPFDSAKPTDLTPCPNCSRTFNLNALRKHVAICEKTSKKRKLFDSSRQRREGTSLSTYVLPKNFGLPNAEKAAGVHSPPLSSRDTAQPEVSTPLPTRRNSKAKAQRKTSNSEGGAGGGASSSAAAPASSSSGAPAAPALDRRDPKRSSDRPKRSIKDTASDRCPHCDRTFNPKAFDRHVEWCKEKAVQAAIKAANSTETAKAKERLDARKQYKPPNLKTKRSMNRDKYSHHEELLEAGEMMAPKPSLMTLSSMTSSVHSENGDKYDPFLSAKRQLEELCSPSTPPEVTNLTPLATPSIAMSTSLTSAAKPIAASTPKVTPISNFRRTSSLRGTRRAPLLSSRPLFATNYRPTIQRGLSDEGPISSNFLKPEEFDEMPVRAACGNDFHSPRVVRRDTSASNRKQQLKLPLGGGGGGGGVGICGGITPTPSNGPGESESPAPVRNVAKTDSLAVFLKYEHDLEQLNAKAAAEMTSKELKDKSNNLSKQNSAKSLLQPGQLPVLSPPATAATAAPPQFQATNSISVNSSSSNIKESNENVPRATFPLIGSKPNTITAPTPVATAPSTNTPIKLESIFIDPKLINACDNLHLGVANRVPSDTSSTTPHNPLQSRSRSSSQSTITQEQRRHSGEARNLFKRKMRLGRNQFLYDASPEDASSGCCSADDEANRSSMEYDEQCWQQQQKQLLANPHLPMPTITPTLAPLVMPSHNNLMPSFDNFDFEEFLSSFENENDEEQFPLFRDCREFLMNRTKRSSSKTNNNIFTATPPQTTTTMTTNNNLVANNSIKSNFAHRCDSSDEKLMRQQSNVSSISSHENDKEKRMADQQKREIFISIETEANAQGRSPISPDSLRHMVGNPQTKIDVLHIDNGNEPEHAKFSKISDTEEADSDLRFDDKVKQQQSQLTSSSNLLGANATPNVQLNNAKNLIQQMQSEFRQLGEDASASMRRAMLRTEESSTKEREREVAQQKPEQIVTATSSHSGDSDEFSSLDGYPMSSSQSSRREGANSKLSSDSAYGSNSPYSLSRQRSSELAANSPRSGPLLRPHTANAKLMDASTQAQTAYGTLKARQRLFAGGAAGDGNPDGAESSSSASDNSVHHKNNNKQQPQQQQQQISNYNYQQQQQQQSPHNSNNNNLLPTPTTSQQSLASSNSSMSSSMKMSKFCHECGGKFVLEHAKFCMECGVRRVVL
ncbi:homeobox protein 5 isoform X2 [Drosophila willistoni]|uniref:homeobox protein 5 isoform X2 n=1 Tax=Drosophila willistoni TaxID=7260 RepID=UPI001F07923B|nr:homeobox protein 5 isoform X2 [Drosophila willistoni]